MIRDDARDRGIYRILRADIELDGAQVGLVVLGEFRHVGHDLRIAALSFPHGRINRIARFRQGVGAQTPEPAGCPGNNNDFAHDVCFLDDAAVGAQNLTVDPTPVRTRQKRNRIGQIFRRTQPLQRRELRKMIDDLLGLPFEE